ncbi:RPA family protein [Halorubrum trueperi]|uniref:RPA family protein n=1 Tax=Halorubrum trueperi TaxID=2004704 RepID=A0ABD5UGB5_9EURY
MREVAQRVFAAEFNDATHTFRESDDDRAPVYALLPTGAKANRVFVVGTLTETEDVGSDDEYWQGRIVDPNGDTFFTYAGQYQPEAAGMLRETEPPAFVALVGKPRTYETDDGTVNVSLRPEHLTLVDESTRNRWVTETAKRTLDRIDRFDEETNEYAQMARDQYGDSVEQYRQAVITAVESLDNASADTATPDAHEAGADTDSVTGDNGSESATSTIDGSAGGDEAEPAGEHGGSDAADDLGDFDTGDVDPNT